MELSFPLNDSISIISHDLSNHNLRYLRWFICCTMLDVAYLILSIILFFNFGFSCFSFLNTSNSNYYVSL